MGKMRKAYIEPNDVRWGSETDEDALNIIKSYLPSNYAAELQFVETFKEKVIVIFGEDSAGWTMSDYVAPRLSSGGMWVRIFGENTSRVCRICITSEKEEGGGFTLKVTLADTCFDCGAAIDFMDDALFDRLVNINT